MQGRNEKWVGGRGEEVDVRRGGKEEGRKEEQKRSGQNENKK